MVSGEATDEHKGLYDFVQPLEQPQGEVISSEEKIQSAPEVKTFEPSSVVDVPKPQRAGPVLRERKIISQLNPPPPSPAVRPKRAKINLESKAPSAPMQPIIESPFKGPRAVWEPPITSAPVSERPSDPRKVWTQSMPASLQAQASEEDASVTCVSTGAPQTCWQCVPTHVSEVYKEQRNVSKGGAFR